MKSCSKSISRLVRLRGNFEDVYGRKVFMHRRTLELLLGRVLGAHKSAGSASIFRFGSFPRRSPTALCDCFFEFCSWDTGYFALNISRQVLEKAAERLFSVVPAPMRRYCVAVDQLPVDIVAYLKRQTLGVDWFRSLPFKHSVECCVHDFKTWERPLCPAALAERTLITISPTRANYGVHGHA